MRLDKFLCDNNIGTRSQVKEYIKKGQVTVNDQIIKKPETKVNEETDTVVCQGQPIHYRKYVYYMLNKPAGVVSATKDEKERTVLSLLPEMKRELFPMGRLDKDTVGLLILTDDGMLAHRLLSPAYHVAKVYDVIYEGTLPENAVVLFAEGLEIGERKKTLPAKLELMKSGHARLTISEGKFHQVKRMFAVLGAKVTKLARVSFAGINLDPALKPGEYRKLTENEINQLKEGE